MGLSATCSVLLQVEVEEEFLTNTLQKKLEKVGCYTQLPYQHKHNSSSIVCCRP